MYSLLLGQFNSVFTTSNPHIFIHDLFVVFYCHPAVDSDRYLTDIVLINAIIIESIM